MVAYKKSPIVFLFATMMIILFMFCGSGEARTLGYGAIKGGQIPCGYKNPNSCVKQPVNHYHRGCEKLTRCARDADSFHVDETFINLH
ncbi:Rapid ALkalinization Factor [Arabidopsis thaliana x Arabidopsis arenosa]|uniref:Rapid ALkalinization Factor n=1 Tax=Arabidopsis thaliana x Arabidopsis arenosa TaxID=1240361 RepID=A0A8T2A7B0_9BRAS|nr:Rapid ALkalinization Factor [Arabidopsis thaliana x Arabidopsis arenosa]